jgi:hypothetical protein
MISFRLNDEQTVKGLRKIAWAAVFRLERQHIWQTEHYKYVFIECSVFRKYTYINICTKRPNGKRNFFSLFGNDKW